MLKYLLLLCLSLVSILDASKYQHQLSIVAITQGEYDYLAEWIDYHLGVGVDHFYIYDNNPPEDARTLETLKPYIAAGIVERYEWPNYWKHMLFFDGCQLYAYHDALKKATHKTKWLALIDTDEFLVPMKNSSLTKALDKYYSRGVLIYVNWLNFGTSEKSLNPKEHILPHLTACGDPKDPKHTFGKTICRPEFVNATQINNVHYINCPERYMDGSGKVMINAFQGDAPIETDVLRINHYPLRDETFLWNIKLPRYCEMWRLTLEEGINRLNNSKKRHSTHKDTRILQLL